MSPGPLNPGGGGLLNFSECSYNLLLATDLYSPQIINSQAAVGFMLTTTLFNLS